MKILRPEEVAHDTELRYDCAQDELAEAYRLGREAFSAADLQKYTEPLDDGVSALDVLRKMELQQESFDAMRKKI